MPRSRRPGSTARGWILSWDAEPGPLLFCCFPISRLLLTRVCGPLSSTRWPYSSTTRITWRQFIAPTIGQRIFRSTASSPLHTTAVVLLTLFLSHFWLRILPWIFTIYLTWSPWHYSGQNYGLFMMFARRAGANPNKAQQRALYGAFIASYLILFLGFHTGPSSDPLFVSLGIPAIVSRWEQVVLGLLFVALSAYGLSGLARATGWRKLLPSLTLFSSQFLWFLLPAGISLVKGLAIPQSRYSSGVLAVMHSAQYLWITSHYARREAAAEGSSQVAPAGLFRRAGHRRHCSVCSRTLAGEPRYFTTTSPPVS